ncbi:MAG: hypothetical protein ACE5GL_02840, partial [Calditrichia bacterium]
MDVGAATLYFNGVTTGFFQNLDSLSSDPFSGSNTAYFTVEVLGSVASGDYTLTSLVTATEGNTGAALSDSSTAANGDTLTVIEPARLRLLSVTSAFDSVSIGSRGVGVRAKIKNSGSAAVLIDSVKLTFSAGTYLFTDTLFSPPLVLGANQSTVVDFSVAVPPGNTPVVATMNGEVTGRDSLSSTAIGDQGADTTDTWRLVTPAQLTFLSISPDSVSNGQVVSFTTRVQNGGQATVVYRDTSTYLDFSGSRFFVSGEGEIVGLSTTSLTFTASTINLPLGNLNGSLVINSFLENGFEKDTTLSPVALTVFDSAQVSINSVTGADSVSQDMNLDLSVLLGNGGAGNADAVIDSVVIEEFGFSQALDSVLGGSGNLTLNISPFVSNSFSGTVPYVVRVYWHDEFIGGSNLVSSSRSVVVLRKAQIEVTGIVNDTLVSRGQDSIAVDVSVFNSGEVTANIDSITFIESIGIYTITKPPSFRDIAPGATETYNFLFKVEQNSATGTDFINVTVAGKDSISGNALQADSQFTWVIEVESNVQILSVNPSQSLVSQGQSNIPVQVIITNQGDAEAIIDSIALVFDNGDTNYTNIAVGSLNDTLTQSQVDTININVTVNPVALTGNDVIDAVGFGSSSGNSIFIPTANNKGTWTVQQRPRVEIPSLSINADTVSTGQTNLLLNIEVRNNGAGIPTSTARIESINLVINGMESDSSNFSFTPQFSTPISLVNNANLFLNYQLTVRDTANSGPYDFSATVNFTDINDGSLL